MRNKLVINEIYNQSYEVEMGQKIWFKVPDVPPETLALSVTANLKGFVPLTAILENYGIDRADLEGLVEGVNASVSVQLYNGIKNGPMLILVPQTKHGLPKHITIENLVGSVIDFCKGRGVKALHFTHYGFVNGKLNVEEIEKILNCFFNSSSAGYLEKLIWDIDARAAAQFRQLLSVVQGRFYE